MSRHAIFLSCSSFLLLATACTDGSEPATAQEPAGPQEDTKMREPYVDPARQAEINAAAERQRLPPVDWLTVELTKVDEAIDGVEFSLSLPTSNLDRIADYPGSLLWMGVNVMDPHFEVDIDDHAPTSIDQAFDPKPKEAGSMNFEKLKDGGALASYVRLDKEIVRVRVWGRSPTTKKFVCVKMEVYKSRWIGDADQQLPWMETIAKSLVVR